MTHREWLINELLEWSKNELPETDASLESIVGKVADFILSKEREIFQDWMRKKDIDNTYMKFFDIQQKEIGKFYYKDGRWGFAGNCDESAQSFLNRLSMLNSNLFYYPPKESK